MWSAQPRARPICCPIPPKSALELSGSDPTVNDALYAPEPEGFSCRGACHRRYRLDRYHEQGGKTLTGKVASTGYATLYPTELGDWTIVFTYNGSQKTKAHRWKSSVSCMSIPL